MTDVLFDRWPVDRCSLTWPISGAWFASLEVVCPYGTGFVTHPELEFYDQIFTGTPYRGGYFTNLWEGLVIGGKGGIQKVLEPKYYKGASLLLVLQDAVREAGEELDPLDDVSAYQKYVPSWVRTRGTLGKTLDELSRFVGTPWRMAMDGKIRVGPAKQEVRDHRYFLVDFLGENDIMRVKLNDYTIEPGDMFEGRLVTQVKHCIFPEEAYSTIEFGY